jgi:hypothetical protein
LVGRTAASSDPHGDGWPAGRLADGCGRRHRDANSWFGARGLSSSLFLAFGQDVKPVRITQHDALAAAFDEPLAFLCAEDAARRMQGCPRHLGDILAADREIDLDSGFHLAAALFGEPQQRMRNALFDLFVRDIEYARLGIPQSASDRLLACREGELSGSRIHVGSAAISPSFSLRVALRRYSVRDVGDQVFGKFRRRRHDVRAFSQSLEDPHLSYSDVV